MRYDIEADWHLLNTCNYRCSYCFFSPEILGQALPPTTAEDWQRGFDRTGLTWLLNLTGGEPTVYPGFAELCVGLTKRHFISMNTNLSRPSILAFADRVDPGRVNFINAGLHYVERMERKGLETFIRHHNHLRDRGFPIFVSIVATPEVLERMDAIAEALRPAGVRPVPKLLRGLHGGKQYPRAYTDRDRERFRRHARLARASYSHLLGMHAELPSINPFGDDDFLHGVPSYGGRMCDAGHRFVTVRLNGRVFRCSDKQALGNILQGTFARRPGPAVCDTHYCFYFCQKHAHPRPYADLAHIPANAGAS
jgi:MoaA/NifB/PqqE/SkfB family radical SAM enzyme